MKTNVEEISRCGDLSPRQIRQLKGKGKKGAKHGLPQSQMNT